MQICHPERAQRVEGSSHRISAKQKRQCVNPSAPLRFPRDDRFVFAYVEFYRSIPLGFGRVSDPPLQDANQALQELRPSISASIPSICPTAQFVMNLLLHFAHSIQKCVSVKDFCFPVLDTFGNSCYNSPHIKHNAMMRKKQFHSCIQRAAGWCEAAAGEAVYWPLSGRSQRESQ